MTFTARYASTCGDCDRPIAPGDQVQYRDDVLTHAQCPTPRPVTICPTCWLAKPCECDDERTTTP